MPREVRQRPPVPDLFETIRVATSRNRPQSKTTQHTTICVQSEPSSVLEWKRLRELELIAEGLEKAIVNIQDAQWALTEKQDEHSQRHSIYGSNREPDDDEKTQEVMRCSRILQIIMAIDRERISKFMKGCAGKSNISVEERMDLESTGVDFDVLHEYLDTKIARVRVRLIDVYETFASGFEASVKADSLPFLNELHGAMRTYLPTELRDKIYALLLPVDKYISGNHVHCQLPSFNPDFHINTELSGYSYSDIIRAESELETAKSSFLAGTHDVHKPGSWLINPSYVGRDMARDLAEIYYSSYGFDLQMRNMRTFLLEDRTKTGFTPMEHLRKRLDIFVATTMGNGLIEGAWANTENEIEFLERVYSNLRHLLQLTHLREISIVIRISTCSPLHEPQMEGDRRFYNIMEAVREPIYDMLHVGVDLEVWHVASSSNKSRVISKGLFNFFGLSKESWQLERQTHSLGWRPSSNFVAREDCQQDRLYQLLGQRWGFTESIDAYGSRI